MSIGVHVSLSILVSSVCMPSSGIAGSYGAVTATHVRGRGQKPGGPHARGAAAKRSCPTSEVRGGGWEELTHVQGAVAVRAPEGLEELFHVQGQEGRWWGDTPRPR